MISIQQINKSYGRQQVLKDITLELDAPQSIALIGPNGSGKTTLIKCLLGLVLPDRGTITVKGQNIRQRCDYRQMIGYMPQINRFPDHMQVSQLFQMMKSIRPDVRESEYDRDLYGQFEIDTMRHKALGALSGGMQQKVSAALAFLFDPSILILDEPTGGLDPVANETLKQKINQCTEEGKLILVTSHILSELDAITSQIIYLMEGEVLFFKGKQQLVEETNEQALNKIIAQIIRKETAHA